MEVYQIVAAPNQEGWNQVRKLPAKPDHPQAGEAVLLLAAPVAAEDGGLLAREIVARFSEKYFLDDDRSRLAALRRSLELLSREQPLYNSAKPLALDLAVVIQRGAYFWLGILGGAEIWLFRQQRLIPLLLPSPEQKIQVLSGHPQGGDLLIASSRQFNLTIPRATLAASLKAGSPQQAEEILAPLVYQQADGRLAAVIVKPTPAGSPFAPAEKTETPLPAAREEKKRKGILASCWSFLHGNLHFNLPYLKVKMPHLGEQAIRVRRLSSASPRQRRWLRFFAFLLLFFFLLSIGLSWRRQQQQRRRRQINAKISQALDLMNKARALRGLDLNKSLQLARQAKTVTETGLKMAPTNPTLKQLARDLDRLIALSGGGQRLSPDLFFDLRVIADDVDARAWDSDGHYFWIWDANGRLIQLESGRKRSQLLLRDPILKQAKGLFVSDKQIYCWNQTGIYRRAGQTLLPVWQGTIPAASLLAGWGGNAYLFDSEKKTIIKYVPAGGKLKRVGRWLHGQVDFTETPRGLAINGSIWLLGEKGKIWRFYAGRQRPFPSQPSFNNACCLTVMKTGPKLAFWAAEKQMVIILNKDGHLLMRLPLKVKSLRGLAFAAGGKKLFLLTKTAVRVLSLP